MFQVKIAVIDLANPLFNGDGPFFADYRVRQQMKFCADFLV
jgi:hypothetical protein